MPDGRAVGFADFGPPGGSPVLWCHGGPGSRLEPAQVAAPATEAGYRMICVDRPGYGLSTPWPGRTIAGWVPDGVAVIDALDVERCAVVGVSTGGAYALALAAAAPERVTGVVACCALTDMRWPEGRLLQDNPTTTGVWEAPSRDAAIALVTAAFGTDGSKLLEPPPDAPPLSAADQALISDPVWLGAMADGMPAMFAHGVQGYVDDRLADGPGWVSFDVTEVRTPVVVLHGSEDSIVDVAQAHHTAEIVPGARVRIVEGLGHLSVVMKVVDALGEL